MLSRKMSSNEDVQYYIEMSRIHTCESNLTHTHTHTHLDKLGGSTNILFGEVAAQGLTPAKEWSISPLSNVKATELELPTKSSPSGKSRILFRNCDMFRASLRGHTNKSSLTFCVCVCVCV